MKKIYPLTIVIDRYNGVYSNGKFLAFNLHSYEIPDDIGGSDSDETNFWGLSEYKKDKIGKGDTPNEAYEDLYKKLFEK